LAVIVVETAKGRLIITAALAIHLPGAIEFVLIARNVVDGFFELICGVAVTSIEEGDQPLYFLECLFPQLTDSLARFLGSPVLGSQVGRKRISDSLWQF
jgi:hypothetical protein